MTSRVERGRKTGRRRGRTWVSEAGRGTGNEASNYVPDTVNTTQRAGLS